MYLLTTAPPQQQATPFPNQNKYDEKGEEITYTISEDAIEADKGYKQPAYAERTEDGVTIHMVTNKHVPGETEVEITKVWADASNQDGVRPDSITVHLFADGTEIKEEKVELTEANAKVNEDGTKDTDTWVYTISGLPKYKSGKLIEYTITEDDFEAMYLQMRRNIHLKLKDLQLLTHIHQKQLV